MKIIREIGRGLRNGFVALGALVLVGGSIAIADYTATQGTGLTFASIVISGKHYAAMLWCDATAGESQCAAVNSSGQVGVFGGAASLVNFQPNGNFAPLTAGASSTQVAAPTGASVAILNTGATTAYINLGTSSSVTATSSNIPIAPFSPYVLEMGSNTNIAAIDPTGTSNLTLIGGSDIYQLTLAPLPSQAASVIIGGVGVPSWAGGTLGAMAAYGTSPGAVNVPGVNAFVTNTPAVTCAACATSANQIVGNNYGNQANWKSGAGSATGTGATTIITAPSANSLYVTGAQCSRDDAGTTAIHVTFNDTSSTTMVLANSGGGGGNNMVFNTPLIVAATTAFTFTSSASTTTVRCTAQAFNAP